MATNVTTIHAGQLIVEHALGEHVVDIRAIPAGRAVRTAIRCDAMRACWRAPRDPRATSRAAG